MNYKFSRLLFDVGEVYVVGCSLHIDHSLGRLTILAELERQRYQLRLKVTHLSSDFEVTQTETLEIPLESILPLLAVLVPADMERQLIKKPAVPASGSPPPNGGRECL